ncbi:MAG: hypothetical protein IH968_02110 [Gemmatimonadetes bacterium]|nr:hypothetical protein [Gemmatimonadota bacterium]
MSTRLPHGGPGENSVEAVPGTGLWITAQWVGIALTGALLTGLVMAPELSLDILWNAVIPVLPAVFMISPALWRNVCPLATLNTLSGRARGKVKTDGALATAAQVVGIGLFFVMVPARRFVFNTDGLTLAVVIVVVAGLALALGFVFNSKAGFCNGVCPVLPVEKLYGQRPLIRLGNPRCQPCVMCTGVGCMDRTPNDAVRQVLGAKADSKAWLLTPFGVFAGGFPGFVWGYFTLTDVPLAEAGAVYLHVLQWMAVSYTLTALIVWVGNVSSEWMLRLLAVSALCLYYWYGSVGIADAWALPDAFVYALRAAAIGLVVVWLGTSARGDTVELAPSSASAGA